VLVAHTNILVERVQIAKVILMSIKSAFPQLSFSFPFPLDLAVDPSSEPACVRSSGSLSSSSRRLAGAGADDPRFKGARFLPLRRTISFSHAFSRRRSFASRSSSSALPVKSPTLAGRSVTMHAPSPEAAVFLRRLSSPMDIASSVPSGSCEVDAAGEGMSCVEAVL